MRLKFRERVIRELFVRLVKPDQRVIDSVLNPEIVVAVRPYVVGVSVFQGLLILGDLTIHRIYFRDCIPKIMRCPDLSP